MIQVRKVQQRDLELLYRDADELCLDKACMSDKLENMMIVLNDDKICGIGCGILVNDSCLLNWIYIHKDYRRDRMGTALVKTILNNAELSGARTAYLSGSCDQFASFLKFKNLVSEDEILKIEELYHSCFGARYEHRFYEASLKDYFKPCGCK